MPDRPPVAAVTGATGFLGLHLVPALAGAGFRPRLLVRRDPCHPLWHGLSLDVVPGDLDDEAALARLVDGADVVIHAAGLVKAPTPAAFMAVNRDGTARLARVAAQRAAGAPFVLISSLAAREPHLSPYAASKRAGEDAAAARIAGERLTVIRPPVIYGPWDEATRGLFELARLPVLPRVTPPASRIATIHVEDAAAAVAALAGAAVAGKSGRYTLSDDRPQGRNLLEFLLLARGGGRRPPIVPLPRWLVWTAAAIVEKTAARRGRAVMFNRGKVREMNHCDWSVDPETLPPAQIWVPRIGLERGIAQTILWYRHSASAAVR